MPDRHTSFGDRLRRLMTENGVSATVLAARIGVTPTAVRKWLRLKKCTMNATQLIALAVLFRVRARWLALGSGGPDLWSPQEISETELLRLYRTMPKDHREMFVRIAAVISRK